MLRKRDRGEPQREYGSPRTCYVCGAERPRRIHHVATDRGVLHVALCDEHRGVDAPMVVRDALEHYGLAPMFPERWRVSA